MVGASPLPHWLIVAPRYTLSAGDVVLRGCGHEPPQRLLESMRAHFRLSPFPQEWGLSVASMPGGDEAQILKAGRQLRQSHYRVASVRQVQDLLGDVLATTTDEWMKLVHLSVVWDHNAHALLLASREPTLELATLIAGAFGPAKVNPYYEERRRTRASR